MGGRTFEQGYLEGWVSVAGEEPLPAERTQPLQDEPHNYTTGFRYGRSDALERYVPGSLPMSSHDRSKGSRDH